MESINANACISGIDPTKINELVEIIEKVGNKNIQLKEGEPVCNGWKVLSTCDNEKDSGLYIAILENSGKEQLMMVFRGTDPKQLKDIYTDILAGLDEIPKQFSEAYKLYTDIKKNYESKNYTITLLGHSLGGGLAEYVGALSGAKTYTFNGLGIRHLMNNHNICGNNIPHEVTLPCNNIENYICKMDPVGNLFTHCSEASFYIPKPENLMKDHDYLTAINILVGFIRAAKNFEDFLHKAESKVFSFTRKRGLILIDPIVHFASSINNAHDVNNFIDIDIKNVCIHNSLIPSEK